MKKRLVALVLCLALLPIGGVSAAGTAQDPLISISYIDGTFIPKMMSAVKSMLSAKLQEHTTSTPSSTGMEVKRLGEGAVINLKTGQTVMLLSGSARFELISGAVVNASMGAVAGKGALNINNRYIVCEDSSVTVTITSEAQAYVSSTASFTDGAAVSPFKDISADQWWYSDIMKAYERGLINGMTASTYEPRGNLSIAQAVKLAACMHQLYHSGRVTLTNSSVHPWYQSYVDYCITQGILENPLSDYSSPITRRQFVEIFHASLPESDYVAINAIAPGAIGDIRESAPWVDDVYDFYRAGILTGYTANEIYKPHDFGAESSITRAEVATILNRLFDHSARVSFSIE